MSVQEKKPFPEDRAAKLALAREKALAVRRKNKEDKMRLELEKMESARKPKDENPEIQKLPEESEKSPAEMIGHTEVDDVEEEGLAMEELKLSEPPPVKEKVVMKVSKGGRKKKEVVIVEQSSDDSDEFESQPNVIFVKRNKKKKEKPPEPPPPEPPPVARQAPPPEPPPPPRLTPEQMQVQQYYHNMFNGVGIAQGGRRRF